MRWNEIIEAFEPRPLEWAQRDAGGQWNSVGRIDGGSTAKRAQVILSGERIEIFFIPRHGEGEEWGLHFMSSNETRPETRTTTNSGRMGSSSPKVFGSVVGAIEDFLKTLHPRLVTFSGAKTLGKASLYAKIAKSLDGRLAEVGYQVGTTYSDEDGAKFEEFWIKPILKEAPLADVSTMGDPWDNKPFDQGTSFGDVDRKIITSPKGVQKMVRAFKNTPFTFKVVFVNHQMIDNTERENEMVDSNAMNFKAGIYKEWGDIIGEPGVIKIALLSNLSPLENKIPVTGWILAHKVGHSIQDHIGLDPKKMKRGYPFAQVAFEIVRLINDIYMEETDHRYPNYINKSNWNFGSVHFNSPEILTMKSARDHKLDNTFEIFAEVVAQYLIKGRVEMRVTNTKAVKMLEELNKELFKLFKLLEGHVLLEV